MDELHIKLTDLIGMGAAILGIGISAWAYMIKRSLTALDQFGALLNAMATRLAVLEDWRHMVDRKLEEKAR